MKWSLHSAFATATRDAPSQVALATSLRRAVHGALHGSVGARVIRNAAVLAQAFGARRGWVLQVLVWRVESSRWETFP
jgi:hypothetical protein